LRSKFSFGEAIDAGNSSMSGASVSSGMANPCRHSQAWQAT